jgi:hypothetical protein
MPSTSERTAWRARVETRKPPSAGNDTKAVRSCWSVSTNRYRPSALRSGSSVRPTTTSHPCSRACSRSRVRAVSMSSDPRVNGSLTTLIRQSLRPWVARGPRSPIRSAISVGTTESATRPTSIGSICATYRVGSRGGGWDLERVRRSFVHSWVRDPDRTQHARIRPPRP